MNKYIKPIIFMFIVVLSMFSYSYFNNSNANIKKARKYINIKNLSKDFMANYFEEVKKLDKEELKYSLIVTTINKPNNNYGASNVIEGPNHQYLFSYTSEKEMLKAKELMEKEENIDRVTENIELELFESNYNSWGIEQTGIDDALNYLSGGSYDNVKVAVFDTGIDLNTFNTYYEGRIKETHNLYDVGEIDDEAGHGTHIAGTIAEATPSNVEIIPFKLGDEKLNLYLLLSAYNYVTYYNKADVINLSLGTEDDVYELYIAIVAANDAGIISVAAAGNDGLEVEMYPAAYDNTISVAAINSSLNHSSWSNYGDTITFSAPGERIKSINGIKSGTSMATPHVASAVAILKTIYPDLTLDDSIRILRKHVVDLGEAGWDKYFGFGMINLENINSIASELNNFGYQNIDGDSSVTINYNYGNNTNILNLEYTFEDGNGDTFTKKLYELSGVEIENYDPFSCNAQNVTIKYNNLSKTINVTNSVCEINAYETEVLDNNSISITGIKDPNMPDYIEITNKIGGKNVVKLGNSLFEGEPIKRIILPSSITTIGNSAFASSDIELVGGASSVVSIGEHAFDAADKLRTFEPSINELNEYSFNEARMLRSVNFDDSLTHIPSYAFYECDSFSELDLTHITSIASAAFVNIKITDLYIPKTLTTIEDAAFVGLSELENIEVESGNPVFDSRENSNNLIDTHQNYLMLGSSNSFIPDSVEYIGSFAFFSNSKIVNIDTKNVKRIEMYAFAACSKLSLVTLRPAVQEIEDDVFAASNKVVVKAFDNKFLSKYSENDNNSPLAFIVVNPSNIAVSGYNNSYTAFDQVGNLTLTMSYDGYIKGVGAIPDEVISDDYTITYPNGSDSFRYGDSYFTINFTNQYQSEVSKVVNVTVNKKNPNYVYTSSDNVVRKDGEYHGINLNVTSPSNARVAYMDTNGNYSLTNMPKYKNAGSYTVNYKIYIDNNYTEVYGSQKVIITENEVNYSKDYEGIYDGNSHTFNLDVRLDNYTIIYSLNNSDFNLTRIPSFSDIGEHVVYYRITSPTYGEIEGSNKIKIYGVRDIANSVIVNNNNLVYKKNSLNSLINTFNIYANNVVYKHYNSNNDLVNTDKLKTGDKLVISILNKDAYSYTISLLGDVSGDGEINSADLLRVRQHLIGTRKVSGSYYQAGDINNDNNINSFDLLRIRQHLIGTKLIS